MNTNDKTFQLVETGEWFIQSWNNKVGVSISYIVFTDLCPLMLDNNKRFVPQLLTSISSIYDIRFNYDEIYI